MARLDRNPLDPDFDFDFDFDYLDCLDYLEERATENR